MEEILKEILQEVKKIQIKIEHGIEPKIQALFEDREIVHEKLDSMNEKIDAISAGMEEHDMQINIIKSKIGE